MAIQFFYKQENNKDNPLQSIGDGFFVIRFPGVPFINNGVWSAGGYLNMVFLRQIDLDLIWYKIATSETKLKVSEVYDDPSRDAWASDEQIQKLSEEKITPLVSRTKRTQWIFDLYELEYDLLVLVSEDVELPDLIEAIGEEIAHAIFRAIKNNPELKKLVNFKQETFQK